MEGKKESKNRRGKKGERKKKGQIKGKKGKKKRKSRKENGLKTTVRGVMNRVMTNVIEFKELVSKKENLPFQLMESFIKDSRVDYQRNLSTLSSNYHHPCDQFCEEVIELISKHIEEE